MKSTSTHPFVAVVTIAARLRFEIPVTSDEDQDAIRKDAAQELTSAYIRELGGIPVGCLHGGLITPAYYDGEINTDLMNVEDTHENGWMVFGPDDLPITHDPLPDLDAVEAAKVAFVKRFEEQGYYSSPDGRIELADLPDCLSSTYCGPSPKDSELNTVTLRSNGLIYMPAMVENLKRAWGLGGEHRAIALVQIAGLGVTNLFTAADLLSGRVKCRQEGQAIAFEWDEPKAEVKDYIDELTGHERI